jgi:hypothetical protein
MNRDYRIRHVRTPGAGPGRWRYDVIATSIADPDVDDVIWSFSTLLDAQNYIADTQAKQRRIDRET